MAQQQIELTRLTAAAAMLRLARIDTIPANELYCRISGTWGRRIDRERISLKLNANEADLVRSLKLPPTVVQSANWRGTYRRGETAVTVTSTAKLTTRRKFTLHSGTELVLTLDPSTVERITNTGDTTMTKVTKGKKNTKPKETEIDDELAGLEELDDLENLADVADVPGVEEDTADETPKTKAPTVKELRAKAKELGVVGASKLTKDAAIAAIAEAEAAAAEPEEKPKSKKDKKKGKKGKKNKDSEVTADDVVESVKETKKAKGKGGAKKGQAPPVRELPAGKVGVDKVAELAGTDARTVRQALRKLGDSADKFKTDGRWAFTEKQAEAIAKKIKG